MAQFIANMPPSVTRGSLPGVFDAVNTFLRGNALPILNSLADAATFSERLDTWTEELARCRNVTWGTARKALNIFIRDATYNVFLRRHFCLEAVEHELELPLDSFTTSALKKAAKRGGFPAPPPWKSIRNLKPEDSLKYQKLALRIAASKNANRCHLDVWYWRISPDAKPDGD